MTAMESRFCHQEKANLQTVEEQSMDDDRLSTTAGPPLDENECLGNAETSSAKGLHETPLAGSLPPLVDFVSPVEDGQSQNTQHNESNVEETGENFSSTGFFDPEQTTARRWAPTKAFGAFLEKNLRRRMTTDQVNEIVGVYAPPEMDACVAPILDKNILNYIPSDRKKFIEQRDRDLALVQRAMLNAAAPFCCLHDRLESNEDIPKYELLCALQQSLCLLGSANHITTALRRKKILAAINPDKVQLAEQEFPKAGKLLFGEDLPNLAAKHSELTKSLSKNLQKHSPMH